MKRSSAWIVISSLAALAVALGIALAVQRLHYEHEMLRQKKLCDVVLLRTMLQQAEAGEELCRTVPLLAGQPNCQSLFQSGGGLQAQYDAALGEYRKEFGDKMDF